MITRCLSHNMKIKNKSKLIILLLCLLVIFLTLKLSIKSETAEFTCTSVLKKEQILQDGLKARLDTDIYLFLDGKGQGFINYDGVLLHNKVSYRVKRLVNFSYSHRDKATVYGLTWHGGDVAHEDNLPVGELTSMVLPEISKVFYQFKSLDEKTVLILQDGLPAMACAIG